MISGVCIQERRSHQPKSGNAESFYVRPSSQMATTVMERTSNLQLSYPLFP
jgi:hypothetical protein